MDEINKLGFTFHDPQKGKPTLFMTLLSTVWRVPMYDSQEWYPFLQTPISTVWRSWTYFLGYQSLILQLIIQFQYYASNSGENHRRKYPAR